MKKCVKSVSEPNRGQSQDEFARAANSTDFNTRHSGVLGLCSIVQVGKLARIVDNLLEAKIRKT